MTPEQATKAHAEYMSGDTVAAVAKRYHCGVGTLYKQWGRLELPRRPTKKGRPRPVTHIKLTDEQVIDAHYDYMANPVTSIQDVATPLGVTTGALCHRWKKLGLNAKGRNEVRYAKEQPPEPPPPPPPWLAVLDTAEVKPRRAGDKWACDVYIQGSRWRTFRHRYRGPALELGRRYVRALVAELTGDGWKGAEVATGD